MKIRVEQINPVIGDIDGNSELILSSLKKAEEHQIELLILPEMVLTGYPVQDLLENEAFREYCYQANQNIISSTGETALLFGTLTPNPFRIGRKIFNSGLLCMNGELLGQANKTLLPNYDIFDDLRYFEPSGEIKCLELKGVKLGVTVCEDIWYNENEVQYHYYTVNPAAELKAKGARVIINISASPFTKSKHENRRQMMRNHADSLKLPLFYCNQTGAQTDVVFDGDTMVMNSDGEIVAETEPFVPGYADAFWNPDTGEVRRVDEKSGGVGEESGEVGDESGRAEESDKASRPGTTRSESADRAVPGGESSESADRDYGPSVDKAGPGTGDGSTGSRTGIPYSQSVPRSSAVQPEGVDPGQVQTVLAQPSEKSDNERLFKAMLTGVRDYLGKTGISHQVVMGLSGGIDSALVAVIAAEALGSKNVMALLMPGDFSSRGSIQDSEKLAENLGINHRKVPISRLYSTYQDTLAPLFQGTDFGVAEENLQSRIRGALLMAYSNKFGPMLLSTGNKSELAVGYATLYGDMNGGLNPIGDLYKTEVFQLCRWLNSEYFGREIIPREILEKPPSAELRPDQKDTDSLPDYEILDDILWRYIDLQQESEKIVREGNHDKEVVRYILQMVDHNEFKRFQAPPILKLSSKSFGSGRRWPLVQSWTGHKR